MEELLTLIVCIGWLVVGLLIIATICVSLQYKKMVQTSAQEID